MKPGLRRKIVEWILNSWKSMPVESCALLTLPNGRQKEDQISCFKLGRPCAAGCQTLNQQMKLLTDERLHINPFSQYITINSDIKDVNEKTNIIESNEKIDEI